MPIEERVARLEVDMQELKELVQSNALAIAALSQQSARTDQAIAALSQQPVRTDQTLNQLGQRVDLASQTVDRLGVRVDSFIYEAQRLFTQIGGSTAETKASVESLVAVTRVHSRHIEEMQAEVRGLQTENRRILERWDQEG